jgi:hypothetical protein
VLDRHCTGCHSGGPKAKAQPSLTGEARGEFSVSYENLKPSVRWYEWGGKSIAQAVTFPGHGGAEESPLMSILEDANHKAVGLSAAEREQIVIWLDGNAPFYGTYSVPERLAQHRGEAIPPPAVQ